MAAPIFEPQEDYFFRDGYLCRKYKAMNCYCTVWVPWSVSGKFSTPFDVKISWEKREPKMTGPVFRALYKERENLLKETRRLQRDAKRCLT